MTDFLENLQNSLITGFINNDFDSLQKLQPKILVNDKTSQKKILSNITENLHMCDEFTFAVAFVTSSGVMCLHNAFKELEEKNVKGNIIISDYTNFTQPEGLRKLLRFKNIKSYFLQNKKFHGKCFLFKSGLENKLIIGSSNLTQDALSTNFEINVELNAHEQSKVIKEIKKVHQDYKNFSALLTEEVIDAYEKNYKEIKKTFQKKQKNDDDTEDIIFRPNSMQTEAIDNLSKLREQNKDKALVISATATGKTVMAAFDANEAEAKKLLFVVHRGNIARKAMETFKLIFKNNRSFGLYSGNTRDMNSDFIFSTVQTINNEEHMRKFSPNHFDYIIIDETHRAGGQTYQKIINYFKPQFLLGMTATPERTDGFDIFSLFDHNIGYEIRLNRALDEGLLCPFHYYGVTDISVDGKILDENSDFNLLLSNERVDRIIEKTKLYGCDDGNVRGLIFCSRIEESENLSKLFNEKGFKTIHLSGQNSEEERSKAIQKLESINPEEKIDYIFTVDIFNEGIDIPKINQIVMLRPTQSAIIFVQQLGRGLRKADDKEYLTVIDFIGNYQNNYMIPIALYGDQSFEKDTLRKLLSNESSSIAGSSTVNFDKIAKEKIFEAINSQNLQVKKDLDNDYKLLKYKIGRIPMMIDFIKNGSRDPYQYVNKYKSYSNYINTVEDEFITMPPEQLKLLEYLSKFINDGKRLYESLILRQLCFEKFYEVSELKKDIIDKMNIEISDKEISSAIHNLNLLFITEKYNKKIFPVGEMNKYSINKFENEKILRGNTLDFSLKNEEFKKFLIDSTNYSIESYLSKFKKENFVKGFLRYEKYSRRDIHRILNWKTNPVAQNVGGYKVSDDETNCPIFVTYEKNEHISDSTKYEDQFIDPFTFTYMSKSNRRIDSREVQIMLNQKLNNIRLPLFIKKSDDEGINFYFMGDLRTIDDSFVEQTMDSEKGEIPVVKMNFKIDKQVDSNIYKYITSL